MPRAKKDGHHINYYIDRNIYEKLKSYADEKGQSMTTAIERILEQYIDEYNAGQKDENYYSENDISAGESCRDNKG